ncbi:Phosphoglucosamine mutase [subsurface metagenome]
MLAKLAIEEEGEGNVILSIDSSTCIDNVVKLTNSKVIRTNLGELHGKAIAMIAKGERVIFAAEPWKPIHPKWGLWIDGLYSVTKILKFATLHKTTIVEVMKTIPNPISERKSYLINGIKVDEIYKKCKRKLEELLREEKKEKLTIDGLRYDMGDGTWILIRKSGTEPKIRLYYESLTMKRFDWIKSVADQLEILMDKT